MSFLDKLPKIPFLSKENQNTDYFFALNISPNKVAASVWGVEGKNLHIINSASSNVESEDGLILAANFALDDALADFEPEPNKILFGVPDAYLQDDDLKPEYLKVLKQMVKELDILPMAYVSTSHAISHYMQKLQGVPLTGILVEIADPLNIAVVKAGKILGAKQQKRTGNLPEDIEKTLLNFTDVEVLPSKILIYGGNNLEKYKEELSSYSWMSQLPFLHLPRIDSLDEDIIIKAISYAGATEVYPDLPIEPARIIIGSFTTGRVISPSGQKITKELDQFGFIEGDIEQKRKLEEQSIKSNVHNQSQSEVVPERDFQNRETGMMEVSVERNLGKVKNLALAPFNFFKGGVGDGLSGLGGLAVSRYLKLLLVPIFLVIFLVLFLLFIPKAVVTVYVDPETLEKETIVTSDPTIKAVDETAKKIPGQIIETDVSGSQKGEASGKKKVGDPAKGSVVVYNKTSSSKTLAGGTVLQGPNNLNFTIDSKLTIASQSAVEGGISFGKATVNATAQEIGPDSNLAAGKELSVKGFSSSEVTAKVDQAFSGGISKDVTVITSEDQKKLLAALSSELRKKAKDELQAKLKGDLKVLEESLAEKIVKQTFNKNVNDQATELSLNLVVNFRGTAYSDTDLRQIVSKLVETNIPEGYILDLTKTETQADVTKIEKDGKLVFTAKFRAKLMPKLDEEKIKQEIAFKTPQQVEEKLKTLGNVIGAEVKMSPSLPGPLARLPMLSKNIKIEVTAK